MATVSPSNFKFVNASGDDGEVKSLSDADITLINNCLQDVENLKYTALSSLPAGTMVPFAGNVVPAGFLICNGAAVSRTDYANLFAAIGTLYGAGDGSTTFNLPDARDRVLQGASGTHSAGSYIAAGLPNIIGYNGSNGFGATSYIPSGAMSTSYASQTGVSYSSVPTANGVLRDTRMDASKYSAIYSDSVNTVQPPAIASYILIKY